MKKSFLSIYMLISISLLSCDVSRLNQRNINELKIFVEKAKYYSIKLDAIYNECTGAYNDIMTYSEGTFSDQSKVNQAISIFKKRQ